MNKFKVGEIYRLPEGCSKGETLRIDEITWKKVKYTYLESGSAGEAHINGEWANSFIKVNNYQDEICLPHLSVSNYDYFTLADNGDSGCFETHEEAEAHATELVDSGKARLVKIAIATHIVKHPEPQISKVVINAINGDNPT